jgi:hypothetical protein
MPFLKAVLFNVAAPLVFAVMSTLVRWVAELL